MMVVIKLINEHNKLTLSCEMNAFKLTLKTAFTDDNKMQDIFKKRSNRCKEKYFNLCSRDKTTEFSEIACKSFSISDDHILDVSLQPPALIIYINKTI